MWVFEQSGRFRLDGEAWLPSYSGFGPGKNVHGMQAVVGIGPIPVGAYLIGSESDEDNHGPVALHLIPLTGTNTFSRSGFLLHGDSLEHPGAASHGCIILPRPVRERIRDSRDKLLVVLSGLP